MFECVACIAAAVASGGVPTLEDMAGDWFKVTGPVSAHVNASDLDLPILGKSYDCCSKVLLGGAVHG